MSNLIDTDCFIYTGSLLGFGQQKIIAISSELYCAFKNQSNMVEVHKSTNGGQTWVLDYTSSYICNGNHISLIKSADNKLCMCYHRASGNDRIIVFAKKDTTWSESDIKTYTYAGWVQTDIQPLMLLRKSDNAIVIITSIGPTGVADYIGYTYSTDNGSNFTSNTITFGFTTVNNYIILSQAQSLSSGEIVIITDRDNFGDKLTRGLINATGTTISLTDFFANDATPKGAALVIDSADNEYVIASYTNINPDTNTHITVYKNRTTSLLDVSDASEIIITGMLDIALDSSNNVIIFYVKQADNKIYTRTYNGSTWTDETEYATGLAPSCEKLALTEFLNVCYSTNT